MKDLVKLRKPKHPKGLDIVPFERSDDEVTIEARAGISRVDAEASENK